MSVNGSFLDSTGLSYVWSKLKGLFQRTTTGTSIPSNSNLNNYETPGTYNALSNAIAATITNSPTDHGFRLEVTAIISNTTYIRQTVFPNEDTGYFYVRRKKSTSWSDWVTYKPSAAVIEEEYGLNTEISSGNLDSYTTPGVFYIKTDTAAASITNCPKFMGTAYAGRLEVKYTISTSKIAQFYYPNIADRNIFFERNKTGDTWDAWYMHVSMPATQLIPTNGDLNNYTTPGSYYATVTISAGLSNNPWTASGIKLLVLQTIATNRYIQIIFPSPYGAQTSSLWVACDSIFIRAYGTDGWQPWFRLQGVQVPTA